MRLNVEQRRIIENKPNGHVLVKGVAGSGKTTVAVHKIPFLLNDYTYEKDDKILVITYNKSLINYIKYIYEEIENMLIKENLLVKDEKNNSNIEFRTIIFLEKYVKDSMSYMVNVLVFIITFITLFISVFQQLIGVYVNFLLLPSIILITILIFKVLPRDKK